MTSMVSNKPSSSYHELIEKNPTLKLQHYSSKIQQLKSGTAAGSVAILAGVVGFSIIAGIAFCANFKMGSPPISLMLSAGGGMGGLCVVTGIIIIALSQYALRKKRSADELSRLINEAITSINNVTEECKKFNKFFADKTQKLEAASEILTTVLGELNSTR